LKDRFADLRQGQRVTETGADAVVRPGH
jgi:hypothetical protein